MKLNNIKRQAIELESTQLVKTQVLRSDKSLPLVIEPNITGLSLLNWAKENRQFILENLYEYGAILWRNFPIKTAEEFEGIIAAICGEALEYKYRASPRTQVSNRIYTSTDYPPEQHIFPHNEHAYSPIFPLKIFFFCHTPAQQGGETPIGNNRQILARINPEILDKFIEKKIMYMRNFGDGFGLPWQTVFQTTDKTKVENYCQENNIDFEWKIGDKLRTRQIGSAILKHPQTNEIVWFNHATFFHSSTLDKTIGSSLTSIFAEEDLPTNTYYGDGSIIEPEVLDHLRQIYQEEMIIFPWQKSDILMLDNLLTVHARTPYIPPRKILVGMAEPYINKN